jgi:hypothetical protein
MDLAWLIEHWPQTGALGGGSVLLIFTVRWFEKKTTDLESRLRVVESELHEIKSGLKDEISEVKQALENIKGMLAGYFKGKSESND